MYTILAPNHLQPLSGNDEFIKRMDCQTEYQPRKVCITGLCFNPISDTPGRFAFLLVISMFFISCFGSKQVTKRPVPSIPPPVKDATDTLVTIEPMDTIQWVDADTSLSPILVQDNRTTPDTPSEIDNLILPERMFKDQYRITVLLPFFAGDSAAYQVSRPANWSLDFYLGFKLAFDPAEQDLSAFFIQTLDTRGNLNVLNRHIEKGSLDEQDVIIGPYRSNLAARVAEYVEDRPSLLVSPYSASSRLGKGNPHYLQMNPTLASHLNTIWSYLLADSLSKKPVVFIHGKSAGELAKKALWQSWVDSLPPDSRPRYEFQEIDEKGDMAMEDLLIDSMLHEEMITDIVFPFWDEALVQAMMSKISTGIAEKSVRLFGLPQWSGFDRISPSYFESLQVHITSADFVDSQDSDMQSLKSRYRSSYAQPISDEAVWGYRCGRFVIEALTREGAMFQRFLSSENSLDYHEFSPRLQIERDEDGTLSRIENKNIKILRFEEGRMVIAK